MSYWKFDNRLMPDNLYWKYVNGYCAIAIETPSPWRGDYNKVWGFEGVSYFNNNNGFEIYEGLWGFWE